MSATTLELPLFQHDCSFCNFLGNFNGHDLYHCKGVSETLIARYGGDGDYVSGLVFSVPFRSALDGKIHAPNPELAEARRRAIQLGLMSE